ncbi:MAG: alkaline phosphatase family protein [Actinomycetota bacterium]
MARLIVLGWDSATFDIVDPMIAAGRLPALAALQDRGFRAPLRSTWPPMTDCAWTGAFTGRNAGGHGIFGSWYRAPGAYACRYFSSRDRRAPALWEMTDGVRHLVWNIPMTFPATGVDGVMVAGYGAPPGSSFAEPHSFQERLAEKWPLDDLLDRAPHSSLERFLDDLLRGLAAQAEALPWAIRESGADSVVAVWPHVDRAQHFFWRFRGTDHPLAEGIERVYEAMDAATGAVAEAFPDADVLVVSDHGAGPLKGDVNVGAWLAGEGRAVPSGAGPKRGLAGVAWALPPSVRRIGRRFAPGLARRAMSARLAGQLGSFDWSKTQAFLGFHSDLWLNLAGREPNGTVTESDADAVLEEIAAGLLALRDPDTDEPVFAAAHRRAEVFTGAHAGLAPDLILDSWSAGYRVAPAREPEGPIVIPPAPLAGVDAAWSSDHRPVGIFVGAGPRIATGSLPGVARQAAAHATPGAELSLLDLCPTALALLGQAVPEDLDGRTATEAIDPGYLAGNPIRSGGTTGGRDASAEYSDGEAAAVAAHLKDLGYIE